MLRWTFHVTNEFHHILYHSKMWLPVATARTAAQYGLYAVDSKRLFMASTYVSHCVHAYVGWT